MKHTIIGLAISPVILFSSCSQVDDFDHADANVPTMYVGMEGQDDPTAVTSADIANVVAGFRGDGTSLTRGAAGYTTDVINDQDGNPAIYVINYADDGGFMLISARKSYHPVLAFSDEGHFDTDGIPESGLSIWEQTAVEAVSRSSSMPDDSIAAYRAEWRKYEPVPAFAVQADGNYDDEYYQQAVRILMDSISTWTRKGYNTIGLDIDFIGDNQKSDEIREYVKNSIFPIYSGHEMELSVAIQCNDSHKTEYSNFVKSNWGQEMGFNQAYHTLSNGELAYAGCGPVAVGQIMRFYEHPAKYDWTSMPYNSATLNTSQMLYDIALYCNAEFDDHGTGVIIEDVADVLRTKFNYSCKLNTANTLTDVMKDIMNRRPVYVRAVDTSRNVGHAWVISGYMNIRETSSLNVYTFTGINELQCIGSYNTNASNINYYYMNWGNYGINNGYYEYGHFDYDGTYDYNSQIKTITNITPNK